MVINKNKKKKTEEKPISTASCCSYSNTEEFLKKILEEPPNKVEPTDISCNCGCSTHSSAKSAELPQSQQEIKDYVKKRYASLVSNAPSTCCGPPSSDDLSVNPLSLEHLGYTEQDLQNVPKDVTEVSFGCGNPTAIAELNPGESVLDLGSGGGIDVLIAAEKVGPTGKAIGLDMTPEMIQRANASAKKLGLSNVEFKLGEIEKIPLPDNSIDAAISNCVINLSPDKARVFQEVFRVLKPGGRLAISDIVLNGELPESIKHNLEAWTGCIAGALQEEDYLQKITDAGFTDVRIESKRTARELYSNIKLTPEISQQIKEQINDNPEEIFKRIVSIKVKALKPL